MSQSPAGTISDVKRLLALVKLARMTSDTEGPPVTVNVVPVPVLGVTTRLPVAGMEVALGDKSRKTVRPPEVPAFP